MATRETGAVLQPLQIQRQTHFLPIQWSGKDPSEPGSSNNRSSQELKVPFFERPFRDRMDIFFEMSKLQTRLKPGVGRDNLCGQSLVFATTFRYSGSTLKA